MIKKNFNNDKYFEAIANAKTARALEQEEKAFEWIKKALIACPHDPIALRHAGLICIALDRLDEADTLLKEAAKTDSENGELYFHMGNVAFMKADIEEAIFLYQVAQTKICTDELKPKVFYQLALCHSIKGETEKAFRAFQQYEEFEPIGAIDPDVISEKLKLSLMDNNYSDAAKYAAEWTAMNPNQLNSYMTYYNVLVLNEEYVKAENVLQEAETYACHGLEDQKAVQMERVSLYLTVADATQSQEAQQQAYALLQTLLTSEDYADQKPLLMIQYAELCRNMQQYDDAVKNALPLLKAVYADEIPEFNELLSSVEAIADVDSSVEFKERILTVLLNCYEAQKQYANCVPLARKLKASQVKANADYANYLEAIAIKNLPEHFTAEQIQQACTLALAYLKNRMLSEDDRYSATFYRARLYADTAQTAKAKEIAKLLTPEDQKQIFPDSDN